MAGRVLNEYDRLAARAADGMATAFQRNLLAGAILDACRTVARMAAADGRLRACDVDDAAQEAAYRAWERLPQWDAERSGIITYASIVARSVVGDYGRRYGREQRALSAAAERARERQEEAGGR